MYRLHVLHPHAILAILAQRVLAGAGSEHEYLLGRTCIPYHAAFPNANAHESRRYVVQTRKRPLRKVQVIVSTRIGWPMCFVQASPSERSDHTYVVLLESEETDEKVS
ncbi:hypothetical protein F5B21DRAFT_336944 [Xylaria acuta]|nr:hypothetical protein F5B21DRAFT_336944 [Xylaria acuta]